MGWNHLEGDQTTELFTCGFRKEIKSSFNQKFIVDYTLDEVDLNDFGVKVLHQPIVFEN